MAENGESQKDSVEAPGLPTRAARMVFISYASQDVAVADTIVAALERAGLTCWLAPRNVVPGAHYADEIVQAINEAKLVVLVLSEHSVASPHVGKEIERTASKGKRIVALRIDSAAMPRAFEYFLSESQWIDVGSRGIDEAAAQLVEAVKGYVDRNEAGGTLSGNRAPTIPATPPSWRNLMVIAVIVVASLALLYLAADKHGRRKEVATTQAIPLSTAPEIPTPAAPEKSVAVLPFADMSEKKDQEYFSDGLSEELIDMLAKVEDMRVPARTSSFYYKGKQVTIAEIGKALGVTHVLEGSVRKAGKTLRITAQLIRVDNGYHVWSQTYDRQLNDVFKVQDEIANAVVTALKVSLRAGALSPLAAPKNVEVYNLMLHARFYHYRNTPDDAQKAVDYYRQVTQLDPTYATGWAGLSRAISELPNYGLLKRAQSRDPSLRAAQRALALDPDLAEAHIAMGKISFWNDWDWAAAEVEFRKANSLDPRDPYALMFLGDVARALGRVSDAAGFYSQAIELDPMTNITVIRKAELLLTAGNLPEAENIARHAIELNPIGDYAHWVLALILVDTGRLEAALSEVARMPDPATRQYIRARSLQPPGNKADADEALADFEKTFSADRAYAIAGLHALRGEAAQALMWLNRAYEQRDDDDFFFVMLNPDFKSLRGDPRFTTFLRRMHLVQ